MTKHKGHIITGIEIRTGDVLMAPTVHADSTVTHTQTFRECVFVSLANGGTVEIPHAAKIRVHRGTKTVNLDEPLIIFSTGF